MTTESKLQPHPICRLLRELRHAAGLSLAQVEARHGISAVVLGAYERGDRLPPVSKLDAILRQVYGYELRAAPIGTEATQLPGDMAALLRAVADQMEERNGVSGLS